MGSAPTTPGLRGRASRLGGEQTVLGPAAAAPAGQLALGLAPEPERTRTEPRPCVVLVPNWLDLDAQRTLVAEFRDWARPPAGLRSSRVPTGHLMSTQAVCLGWHWYPYAYNRTADGPRLGHNEWPTAASGGRRR